MDLLAACLISALLVPPVGLGEQVSCKVCSCVQFSDDELNRDVQSLGNLFIILALNFSTILFLTFLRCSLDFMMLSAPQYSLNKPLRLSHNSRICTEIRLHTNGLYLVIKSTFNHSAIIR